MIKSDERNSFEVIIRQLYDELLIAACRLQHWMKETMQHSSRPAALVKDEPDGCMKWLLNVPARHKRRSSSKDTIKRQ